MLRSIFYIFLSFIICSFGLPSFVPFLGILAAFCGYALFWQGLQTVKRKNLVAFLWFFALSLIQIAWMSDATYTTRWIWLAYLIYAFLLAITFTLCMRLVFRSFSPLLCAALFTLMEYVRLFVLTGLPWTPAGLHLACLHFPSQLAAYVGVLGMSFYVYLCNGLFYRALQNKHFAPFIICAAFPFVLGFFHTTLASPSDKKPLNVYLMENRTAARYPGSPPPFLHQYRDPIDPWRKLLPLLANKRSIDLLVFPEGGFLTSLRSCRYSLDQVIDLFTQSFPLWDKTKLPQLLMQYHIKRQEKVWVNSAYICQALANFLSCDIIAGFGDYNAKMQPLNSAFLFRPFAHFWQRYNKRLLVPLGEYFPFSFARSFAAHFDILDEFIPGNEVKVFSGKMLYGISICYEEAFSHIYGQIAKKRPDLFVNIGNNIWFPYSKLASQQRDLARLRSIEFGLFSLRANNLATSGIFDPFGRSLGQLQQGKEHLFVKEIMVYKHRTLYALWGDFPILFLSFSLSFLAIFLRKRVDGYTPFALNQKDGL